MLFCCLLPLSIAAGPATKLAGDESLRLLPTHAVLDTESGKWRIHLHAWVFEPKTDSLRRRAAKAAFAKAIKLPDEANAQKRFDRRMKPFLIDNERGKTVVVKLGKHVVTLGKTAPDGHSKSVFELTAKEFAALPRTKAGTIRVEAVFPNNDSRAAATEVRPVPEKGPIVISDIDDTIKTTNVGETAEMLANTFYREFQPVAGMARVYQRLAKDGASFHYVSASPWQLHESLEEFRKSHGFPIGVFHLRRFRIRSLASLSSLDGSTGKKRIIEAMMKELPGSRFMFFGDSGENDPEIYGELARKFPKQIESIAIRNVNKEKADSPRMQKAFAKVDANRWQLFTGADELE